MKKVKIAVAGAGLAGRQHITAIAQIEEVALAAVADPDARAFAGLDDGVPRYASLDEMLDAARPDGVIIATPNHLHVAHGLACVEAGVPALIEKPIAADTASAAPLVAAAEAGDVALLIGHHRRHNPLVAAARRVIADGELGRLLAVHAQTWLIKPDDYFRAAWRKQQGAGPVFINLIHDIDLLRHATGETCYWLGGSEGALALPNLTLWKNPAERSWWAPMAGTRLVFEFGGHALTRQLQHFASVIRGEVAPLVSPRDGLASLAAVEAINHAAKSGESVAVADA